jgi:hypothetical protein
MRKSYKSECRAWYEQRLRLGVEPHEAVGYVYSWHEEGEPAECKIGYCSKDPFQYLWEGTALSHQKRLPVIFLSIGTRTVAAAKLVEQQLHSLLESKHMSRSCAREWFVAHRDEVCESAKSVVRAMEAEGAI